MSYLLPPFLLHLGALASADSKQSKNDRWTKLNGRRKRKHTISPITVLLTLRYYPIQKLLLRWCDFSLRLGGRGAQEAAHSEKINSGQKGVLSLLYQFMLKKDASDKISREKERSAKMTDLLRAPLICRIQWKIDCSLFF